MKCVEYILLEKKYKDAFEIYESILAEQERLFIMTQPKSMRYDQDRVQTTPSNVLETYITKKEEKRIDSKLRKAKCILKKRESLLEDKKRELILSREIPDLIYRYRYIENIKCSHIAEMLGYSQSQIYRIIDGIFEEAKRCEQMRKVMC